MKRVLIVGGVAGGATAAARLRRLDEKAEIIIFERGEFVSYANCGLPYFIGGEITERRALTLQSPQGFKSAYNIEVRVFCEAASIDRSKKTLAVKNLKTGELYTESYDALILSPGAAPFRLNIEGVDSDKVFTLRSIPDTLKIKNFIDNSKPQSAIVIGGGYIGLEMAENLVRAGLSVTIAEALEQVVSPLDYEMAGALHSHIESKNVRLLLNNGIKSISEEGSGLRVRLERGEIQADMLIMAAGVRPESALAAEAGLSVNSRGFIITNEHMQTSDSNIYAVGDAVETTDYTTGVQASFALAGPANKQARIAADNVCGIPSVYEGAQGSSVLRVFDMTAAATGINEKTAKRLGLDYEKSYTFSPSHAEYYPGATNMSVKTIFEKGSGRILGAQIVGFEGVDKRADVFAAAIRAGLTAGGLISAELCYAPPYSSAKDPVNIAGCVIENILTGKMKVFHWHDVQRLFVEGGASFIDVRSEAEFSMGSIDGFVNIPLQTLRERLEELDRDKPVYVTCQIGKRGYLACRILEQNGFDAYNLSGGCELYNQIYTIPQAL